MRLTLRTLLAYMDDILDPADHEDLGKKIEASDFATELIHRSRDAVRRLRLGAPDVLADDSPDVLDADPAKDANAVAAYLDNTLPPEQVAEFERACLDTGTAADVHLAEVTSCHHILTMVLGEPAEIDHKTRRRMYDLVHRANQHEKLRIEPAHPDGKELNEAVAAASEDAASPPVPLPPVAAAEEMGLYEARDETEVPDYLRAAAHQRRSRRFATAAVLAVLGGLTVYLFFSALEKPETPPEVASALEENDLDLDNLVAVPGAEPSETAVSERQAENTEVEDSAPANELEGEQSTEMEAPLANAPVFETTPGADDSPSTASEPEQSEETASEEDGAGPLVLEAPQNDNAEEEGLEDLQSDLNSPTLEEKPLADPLAADLGMNSVPEETGETASTIGPEGLPEFPELTGGTATNSGEPVPGSAETSLGGDTVLADTEAESGFEIPPPPEPAGPVQLGTYIGKNDVLLRYNSVTEEWVRLPPQAVIIGGDKLLALPKYRTHVVLGNVSAYLCGGTQITVPEQQLASDSEQMRVQLQIDYGRVILHAGASGSNVVIHAAGEQREFHLDDSADLAIDVHHVFIPGSDFLHDAAPAEINWYLTSGGMERTNAAGTNQFIQAPSTWVTSDGVDDSVQPITALPKWIEHEQASSLELRARDRFTAELAVGRPVGLRLQELNEENNATREVRALSAEASLHVGEFEPFVNSLNDSDQAANWGEHIQAMRQALARSPRVAEKLNATFVKLRGNKAGGDLMSMVRGFGPEEIGTTREEVKQGVVLDLIGWLEHPSLDYRVLAIYNLDEIRGTKNFKGYRPAEIQRSRDKAVAKIRAALENNEFVPAR